MHTMLLVAFGASCFATGIVFAFVISLLWIWKKTMNGQVQQTKPIITSEYLRTVTLVFDLVDGTQITETRKSKVTRIEQDLMLNQLCTQISTLGFVHQLPDKSFEGIPAASIKRFRVSISEIGVVSPGGVALS